MRTLKEGFTLIELLIVVAIIAILAAIAVPNFLEAQVRSKVSRVKSDMSSLATALEAYAVDYNDYPHEDVSYIQYIPILTTPIAYITSTDIIDPFQDEAPTPSQYVPASRIPEWKGTYHYVNYSGGWGTGCHPDWVRRGCMTSSYGPDKTQAWMEHYPYYYNNQDQDDYWGWEARPPVYIHMPYDPSNGTKSWGGIGRPSGDMRCSTLVGG